MADKEEKVEFEGEVLESFRSGMYRIALDNSRARAQLGWAPQVSLEEGLSGTVDYFRERVSM